MIIYHYHGEVFSNETWISKRNVSNLDIKDVIRSRYSGGISVYFRKSLKGKISVVEKRNSGSLRINIKRYVLFK